MGLSGHGALQREPSPRRPRRRVADAAAGNHGSAAAENGGLRQNSRKTGSRRPPEHTGDPASERTPRLVERSASGNLRIMMENCRRTGNNSLSRCPGRRRSRSGCAVMPDSRRIETVPFPVACGKCQDSHHGASSCRRCARKDFRKLTGAVSGAILSPCRGGLGGRGFSVFVI